MPQHAPETTGLKIQGIAVGLIYRGDYTPSARELVQQHIVGNDLPALSTTMADSSKWSGVPSDRFKRRESYLRWHMKKISLLFLLAVFSGLVVGGEIDYSKIAEASSARITNTLIRYSRLYGEPCANIQIINSKNWEAVETKRICELNGLSLESEVADAYFSNPKFSKEGVHLELSITPLEPIGEQKKTCIVPIRNKNIGDIECADRN